jgi:hypothetical protein
MNHTMAIVLVCLVYALMWVGAFVILSYARLRFTIALRKRYAAGTSAWLAKLGAVIIALAVFIPAVYYFLAMYYSLVRSKYTTPLWLVAQPIGFVVGFYLSRGIRQRAQSLDSQKVITDS